MQLQERLGATRVWLALLTERLKGMRHVCGGQKLLCFCRGAAGTLGFRRVDTPLGSGPVWNQPSCHNRTA